MDDVKHRVKQADLMSGVGFAGGQAAVQGFGGLKDLLYDYMKTPLVLAGASIPLAAGVGGVVGGGLGAAQSQDADPEELKKQELLQAYMSQTARIKQLAAANKPAKGVRSPRLLQ